MSEYEKIIYGDDVVRLTIIEGVAYYNVADIKIITKQKVIDIDAKRFGDLAALVHEGLVFANSDFWMLLISINKQAGSGLYFEESN